MNDVIDKIARIDAAAFENEQRNQSILNSEKQRLENEMKKYREEKLNDAYKNAEIIYRQIVDDAKREFQKQEEKIKEISERLNSNYFKMENAIIKEVLAKLFP